MAKPASALEDEPSFFESRTPKAPELPVQTTLDKLTKTQGEPLQISTRADRSLTEAITMTEAFAQRFNSPYVRSLQNLLMRLAVARDGKGRIELTEALKAGGAPPDAYYEGAANGGSEVNYVREER